MDTGGRHSAGQSGRMAGLDDPLLSGLESYWQTLRHARRIPARNDVKPHRIDAVLPYAFILQRVAPGMARFRVAGQRLHDLLKMDARGMPFSTLFTPDTRQTLQHHIETAFDGPAIVALPLISPASLMRPALQATVLFLPMQDDKGQTNRLLGALVCDASNHNRPRRFEIDPAGQIRTEMLGLSLASSGAVLTNGQNKRPDAKKHPALRLVVNNG